MVESWQSRNSRFLSLLPCLILPSLIQRGEGCGGPRWSVARSTKTMNFPYGVVSWSFCRPCHWPASLSREAGLVVLWSASLFTTESKGCLQWLGALWGALHRATNQLAVYKLLLLRTKSLSFRRIRFNPCERAMPRASGDGRSNKRISHNWGSSPQNTFFSPKMGGWVGCGEPAGLEERAPLA